MTSPQPSGESETIDLSAPPPSGPAYDAFISYSHVSDRRLAPALRDGLHRFAKPWYRRRAMRVFQDASNLFSKGDHRLRGPIRTTGSDGRFEVLVPRGSTDEIHIVILWGDGGFEYLKDQEGRAAKFSLSGRSDVDLGELVKR